MTNISRNNNQAHLKYISQNKDYKRPSSSTNNHTLTFPSSNPSVFQTPEHSLPGNLALLRVGAYGMNQLIGWGSKKLSPLTEADKRFTRAILPSGAKAEESFCVQPDNNEVVCIVKKGPRRSDESCFKLNSNEKLCTEIVTTNDRPTQSSQVIKSYNRIEQQNHKESFFFRKSSRRNKKTPKLDCLPCALGTTAFLGYAMYKISQGINKIYKWFNPEREPLIRPEFR